MKKDSRITDIRSDRVILDVVVHDICTCMTILLLDALRTSCVCALVLIKYSTHDIKLTCYSYCYHEVYPPNAGYNNGDVDWITFRIVDLIFYEHLISELLKTLD